MKSIRQIIKVKEKRLKFFFSQELFDKIREEVQACVPRAEIDKINRVKQCLIDFKRLRGWHHIS